MGKHLTKDTPLKKQTLYGLYSIEVYTNLNLASIILFSVLEKVFQGALYKCNEIKKEQLVLPYNFLTKITVNNSKHKQTADDTVVSYRNTFPSF